MSRGLYLQLAGETPNEVGLGGALITMVEPHAGYEAPYNRWYEDDHLYAGAMAGPWAFAGRRYVAPRALRERRFPTTSPGARPTSSLSYVSLYWITAGHVGDFEAWAIECLQGQLAPAGRRCMRRTHVYTAFHDLAFARVFDPAPMQDIHALDHPYGGVVLELVDAVDALRRPELLSWLRDEHVPSTTDPRVVGQCLAFVPRPFRADMAEDVGWKGQDPARRVCLMWFLKGDATESWTGHFASHEAALEATGLGRLAMIAPFVPTIPGTDRYVDELG